MALVAALTFFLPLPACDFAPSTTGVQAAPKRQRSPYPADEFPDAIIVADFQSDEQAAWFRVAGPGDDRRNRPQPQIAPLPQRDDPAERGLATFLRTPDDALTLDVRRLPRPDPPGNWRGFAMLLMSIHGPPAGTDLTFFVSTGDPPTPQGIRILHIAPGWNRVRVDLDQIDRDVDLPDVRALEWGLLAGAGPTTLYLDDLALAGRTTWLFGHHPKPGGLYAFTRGHRLHIGSAERFELVFTDGVITAWYAGSPINLAAPGGLGPWPIVLPPDWCHRPELSRAPAIVRLADSAARLPRARQMVVEASPLRVVIETRPVPTPASTKVGPAPSTIGPELSRRYVVYADGRVFVELADQPSGEAAPDDRLCYAVSLDARQQFQAVAAPSANPDQEPAAFTLLSSATGERADLFWTCVTPTANARCRILPCDDQRSLIALLGGAPVTEAAKGACLLRFWPPGVTATQAEGLATDYQNPAALRPAVGRLVTDAPGDLNHDGFNESTGCYEIALHDGGARFEFAPGDIPRLAPVFHIHDTTGRRCWVYSDGAALPADHRDANGHLLFKLPDTLYAPRTVEIHTRPPHPGT